MKRKASVKFVSLQASHTLIRCTRVPNSRRRITDTEAQRIFTEF
jgi:hypothetical protein